MKKVNDITLSKKHQQLYDSAKSRDIYFDLSLRHLRKMMSRKTCFYTGVRFDDVQHKPSIERVDSTKGYTDDNTVIVSESINKAKSNLTENQLKLILKAIQKHKQLMNK